VFDGAKRHLGSMDALTGKMIKPRDPRKDNSIDVSEIDGPDNRRTV
jgi:hypothetical protein